MEVEGKGKAQKGAAGEAAVAPWRCARSMRPPLDMRAWKPALPKMRAPGRGSMHRVRAAVWQAGYTEKRAPDLLTFPKQVHIRAGRRGPGRSAPRMPAEVSAGGAS